MPEIFCTTEPASIIVRHVDPASVTDNGLLHAMRDWLDEGEIARLARFKQPQHQHAFLVSHALTRKVLADLLSCAPQSLVFSNVGRNKPVLRSPNSHPPLHFNLAHTKGLAVIAVSTEPVGIDIEWLARKADVTQLAKRYFTASEQTDIASQPSKALQHQRFLMYWTLKEAYLKAQAWGIVDRLDGFEFEVAPWGFYPPKQIRLRVHSASLSPTIPWRFHHWQPTSEHLLSLASSARLPKATRVDCQPWDPES